MLDHWRLAWQTRSARPTNRYPALQAYVTLLLKVDRPFCRAITTRRIEILNNRPVN